MKKWFIDNLLYILMLVLILAMGMKINILQENIEELKLENNMLKELYQREINETIQTYENILKGE